MFTVVGVLVGLAVTGFSVTGASVGSPGILIPPPLPEVVGLNVGPLVGESFIDGSVDGLKVDAESDCSNDHSTPYARRLRDGDIYVRLNTFLMSIARNKIAQRPKM